MTGGLFLPFFITGALFGFVLGFVYSVLLGVAMYVLFSYIFAKIGEKFGVGTTPQYFVPIYNIVLLCDCAGVERWIAAVVVLPVIFGYLEIVFFSRIVAIAAFAASVYLWGKLAERLGKNFWLWGVITPILWGFPAAVLAFDSSRPLAGTGGGARGHGGRYINLK